MHRSKLLGALVLFVLVTAACSRGSDETETGAVDDPPASEDDGGTTDPDDGGDDPGLDDGAFGDLGVICQEGDPSPAAEETPGLTDTEVRLATFSDAGFEGAPGLNEEFIDTAEAFVDWCNSHGGINGRQLAVDHRDAKLTEYQQRILESCTENFFMVGGGAVFDDTGQPDRLACGLPDISGFMVTAVATESDLHIEPVPNPITNLNVTDLIYFAEQHPEAITKVWDFTGNIQTTKTVAERIKEAARDLGYEFVLETEYNSGGEANWKPFIQEAIDAGAEAVTWTGQPENFVAMMEAADELGFEPAFVRADANHYDTRIPELNAEVVAPLVTKTTFHPFEQADENQATQDYLDLMAEFNPDGKIALLGAQGLSGWLLFVTAANECDAAGTFTRDCVYEAARIPGWTGGGLHSPQDVPGRTSGECQALLQIRDGEFVIPDTLELTDGPWRCTADAVVEITGDYGTGATCPSGVDDPLPSTCSD